MALATAACAIFAGASEAGPVFRYGQTLIERLPPAPPAEAPAPFSIPPVVGAAPASRVASEPLSLSGMDGSLPLSVTAPSGAEPLVSVDGAPFAEAPDAVPANSVVRLSMVTPATADGSVRSADVAVGTGTARWEVRVRDELPEPLSVVDEDRAVPSVRLSTTLRPTGIDSPVWVAVAGDGAPSARVEGGAWATSPVRAQPGDAIEVSAAAPAIEGTSGRVGITVGGASATWTVTTGRSTPTAPSFPAVAADAGTEAVSATVVPAGNTLPAPLAVSASDGSAVLVSVDGGPFGTPPAALPPGASLALSVRAAADPAGAAKTATLRLGSVASAWSVRSLDRVPESFSFPSLSSQSPSDLVVSFAATVAGFEGDMTLSVSGTDAAASVGGGPWAATVGVSAGDSVRLRMRTPSSWSTTGAATATLGSRSVSWTARTRAEPVVESKTYRVTCTSKAGATQNVTGTGSNGRLVATAPSGGNTWVIEPDGEYLNCFHTATGGLDFSNKSQCRAIGRYGGGNYIPTCTWR